MVKNLNDVIHGDRAKVRGNHVPEKVVSFSSAVEKFKGTRPAAASEDSVGKFKGSKGGTKHLPLPKTKTTAGPCYETHPGLKMPGSEVVVYGGSCSTPVIADADIYVGFDTSMKRTARAWPWKKGTEFLWHIADMTAPSNPEEFKKLIAWCKAQIDPPFEPSATVEGEECTVKPPGLKLHCGCIGGHGRTGTFLAALVSTYGEVDAITYVREHYCDRAVESQAQIDFLHEHFGITKVKGSKTFTSTISGNSSSGDRSWAPANNHMSIWG